MLQAILNGKAGRVTDESGEDQSWRELFRKREDLLTAVFFGRLRYLSAEGQNKVLTLLVDETFANIAGPVREAIFWPRLKGLDGRNHVEPDLLLIFEDTLLMVEVKPPFGGEQSEVQWRAQVESLIKQRGLDSSLIEEMPDQFHFLALGRNVLGYSEAAARLRDAFLDDGLKSVRTQQWSEVCHGVHELNDAAEGADHAVYSDWIEAFQLFGMTERPLPFDDLLQLCNPITAVPLLTKFAITQNPKIIPEPSWTALITYARQLDLKKEYCNE